jgi:hypothetical protein
METGAKAKSQSRRKREVLGLGNLTTRQIEAVQKSEVPQKYARLDGELRDWNPQADI